MSSFVSAVLNTTLDWRFGVGSLPVASTALDSRDDMKPITLLQYNLDYYFPSRSIRSMEN